MEVVTGMGGSVKGQRMVGGCRWRREEGIKREGGLSICWRRQQLHVMHDSDSEAANDGEYAKRGHLNEA
jgi:hypothetical protein